MLKVAAKKTRKLRRAPKSTRIFRSLASREHTFTRIASSNQGAGNALPILLQTASVTGRPIWTNTSSSGENLALQFRLDQVDVYINGSFSSSFAVPNYTEFTNLFDEYCIKKVEVTVLPTYATAGPSASTNGWLPWVIHAADYDDTGNTTCTALQQYNDAQYTQFLRYVDGQNAKPLRVIKPRVKAEVFTASGGNGTWHPKGPQWIVSANPTVPHLGMKMSLDDCYLGSNPGTVIGAVNIICKYTIGCRDTV